MATRTNKSNISKSKKNTKETSSNSLYNLHDGLQKYFGFTEFKGTQEKAINSLIKGNDTFVIMPTGEIGRAHV